MKTESKSFGIALLVWFFLGGLGGHRIYINENVWVILVYWLGTVCTLGILPLVDLFLLKGMVHKVNSGNI